MTAMAEGDKETLEGRNKDWMNQWEKGYWDWVYTQPEPFLAKSFEKITGGRKGMKILVPLTATAYDLIWLCEQGHSVVGADLAESGAQRLFKQYKQTPIIEDVPSTNGKLYKNSSGNFKYYVGDFFKFSEELEGKFDFIFDAGSMCAVHKKDMSKYLKVIRSVMAPKCVLMLEFPKEENPEPPYTFTKQELESYYGDLCDVEFMGESECDLSKVSQGDVDDDGNLVKKKEALGETEEKPEEESEEYGVFMLMCYLLQKRE